MFDAFQTMPFYLFQLKKSYGNIYSLYLGTRPAVVISGVKAIKEALVTKGSDFAGRPQDMFINDAIKTNGKIDIRQLWEILWKMALMLLHKAQI